MGLYLFLSCLGPLRCIRAHQRLPVRIGLRTKGGCKSKVWTLQISCKCARDVFIGFFISCLIFIGLFFISRALNHWSRLSVLHLPPFSRRTSVPCTATHRRHLTARWR